MIVGSGHFLKKTIKPLRSFFWKSNHCSQFLGNHLTIEVIFGKPSNHCCHFWEIIKPLWSFFWKSNHCGQFFGKLLNHCGHFFGYQTIVVNFWQTIKPLNHQTISDLTISACWWISRWFITIVTWFSFVTVNNTWGSNLWSNVAGIKLVFVSRLSSVVLVSPFVWIVAEVFVWKKNQILT